MDKTTENLVNKINAKLKDHNLFYFARDIERALGLEEILQNYKIACIEDSYIANQVSKRIDVFCSDKEGIKLENFSTLDLVKNEKVQQWVKKQSPSKFYAMLFQFNKPTQKIIEELGGIVLNNNPELNRLFETKFSQFRIFEKNNLPTPKSFLVQSEKTNFDEICGKLNSSSFIIQLDRAHTGSGTFFIRTKENWDNFIKDYNGNEIKVSEMITGDAFTINGCITKKGVFVSGLQYQITGYPELTSGEGSTVGNDWSYGYESQTADVRRQIHNLVKRVGEIMKTYDYRGMFGIDLIVRNDEIFLIEINARQTANIPMQTKLEIHAGVVPLMLLHIAEFMNVEIDIEPSSELTKLEGAQVFLRAKNDNFKINFELKSGVYRLQSDNSARKWEKTEEGMTIEGMKEGVILIDEEGDKPLIWQKDGYSVNDLKDGGFILLIQKRNLVKAKFEEIARMQFKNGIIHGGKIAPWILETMETIEGMLK